MKETTQTTDLTQVVTSDLRALLHWASVGVECSVGGSYQHEIEEIIRSYSEHLGIKRSPKFKENI